MAVMPPTVVAIALAIASALATALGMVLRHTVAEQPRQPSHTSTPVLSTITNWRWAAGTGASLLGFALQAAAFNFGSLLLVQPLTVFSLIFTLPLSAHFSERAPRLREWLWATTLTFCVGALVTYGRPVDGISHPHWWQWLTAVAVGIAVMAALSYLATCVLSRYRALLLGIAGGVAFAYVAVLAKGAVNRFNTGGIELMLSRGEVYGLLIAAVVALYVQQLSFAAGSINQAAPASTATTPMVSIILGLSLLGERFTVTDSGLVVIALIAGAMAANTVLLARAAEY